MRNRFTVTLAAVLALCAVAVRGQDGAQPGPSPEMKKLDFLVGKWTAKGQDTRSTGPPVESTAAVETTWTLGGRYQLSRVTTSRENSPPQETLRLIGYDPQARQYRMWTFNSTGGAPAEWAGNFEGERLALTFQPNPAHAGIGTGIDPTPEGHGRIMGVNPGGPGEKAGLKVGDEIIRVEGVSLTPAARDQQWRLVGKAGTPVHLTVRSGGQERDVTVTRQLPPPGRIIWEPVSKTEYHRFSEVQREGRWQKLGEWTITTAP